MLKFLYRSVRTTVYTLVARELADLARLCDRIWYWPAGGDDLLLDHLPSNSKQTVASADDIDGASQSVTSRQLAVFNGVLNSSLDIQHILLEARRTAARGDRLALVLYNPYLRWTFGLADRLGLRKAPPAATFVTQIDLENLARISGWEVVRLRPVAAFPFQLLGIGTVIDSIMRTVPVVRRLALVHVAILRPRGSWQHQPSLTVVIPARNERGNIRAALERMPEIPGTEIEVIFVEGHSSDGTWEEIQEVVREDGWPFKLRAFRQSGKGKADAVRLGFGAAEGELLTILDADLTMPPELLPRFYSAFCAGHGDFVNGSRLVYPMEGEAMRHLNRLGNIFFAKALSWVLEARVGDTLCGTKMLAARDYQRIVAWRRDFGDFDPFGDFELLFPAAVLGLGIIDVPIRYRDRVYGSTNISRFRHGFELVRMTLVGLVRIRMGLGSRAGPHPVHAHTQDGC